MDQGTQRNAALVEEIAHAAEGLRQQAQAQVTAIGVFRLADMPATVSGRAPCLKTGSLNFTRIHFPRAFQSPPDLVAGIHDFSGNQRLVTIVGLTAEYVDLITNYWHAGNTFTYIAVGRLAPPAV